MSVIAIKITDKKIIIGSDSQTTRGDYMKYNQNPNKAIIKLHEFDDGLIIGSVGSAKTIRLLDLFLETNKLKDNTEREIIRFFKGFDDWLKTETNSTANIQDNAFMVVKDKKVYEFSNYYLRHIEDFWSIGSGSVWALAILALDGTVEDALKASCKLDLYCSEPTKIITIDL